MYNQNPIRLIPQITFSIDHLFFHPDKDFLATINNTGAICIWQATSGKKAWSFRPSGYFLNAAFVPNSSDLVVLTSNKTDIYNLQTGHQDSLSTHGSIVVFSSNAEKMAIVQVRRIELWDWQKKQKQKQLTSSANLITSIAFSNDNNYIAIAGLQGTPQNRAPYTKPFIELIDSATNNSLWKAVGENAFGHNHYYICGIANNEVMVLNSTKEQIHMRDINTGKIVRRHSAAKDHRWLALPSCNYFIAKNHNHFSVWDLKNNKTLYQISEESEVIAINPQKKFIATSQAVYDFIHPKRVCSLAEHGYMRTVDSIAISTKGNQIAMGIDGVRIWDLQQGNCTRYDHFFTNSLSFSPDDKFLTATPGGGNKRSLWEVWNWQNDQQILSSTHCKNIVFSPSGKLMAIVSSPQLKIHHLEQQKSDVLIEIENPSANLTWTSDSQFFYIKEFLSTQTVIRKYQANSGQLLHSYSLPVLEDENVWTFALSADDKQLAVSIGSTKQGKIVIIPVDQPENTWQLQTGDIWVSAILFDPEGKWLISGDYYGNIVKWDIASQKPLQRVKYDKTDEVIAIRSTSDKRVVAITLFENAALWDLSLPDPIIYLPGLAGLGSSHPCPSFLLVQANQKCILQSSRSYSQIDIIDTKSLQILISLVALHNDEYLFYTPEGLWAGSKNAQDYIQFWQQNTNITSEELILKQHNRKVIMDLLNDLMS